MEQKKKERLVVVIRWVIVVAALTAIAIASIKSGNTNLAQSFVQQAIDVITDTTRV